MENTKQKVTTGAQKHTIGGRVCRKLEKVPSQGDRFIKNECSGHDWSTWNGPYDALTFSEKIMNGFRVILGLNDKKQGST